VQGNYEIAGRVDSLADFHSVWRYTTQSYERRIFRGWAWTLCREIQSSSKCLAARYNMRPIGTSVSMPADNVKRIGVHFEIVGPLTQDQLRPIMVDCVNQFINSMNANEELRPYLHDYPTSIVNVDVVLFVVDSRGGDLPYPNIVVAKTRDSDLLYSTIQWTPERKDFIHVARESFQVATDIVARSCD
jgi:hypothetical protein